MKVISNKKIIREDQLKIMQIVLDDKNNKYFNELIEKTIESYSKYVDENETIRLDSMVSGMFQRRFV